MTEKENKAIKEKAAIYEDDKAIRGIFSGRNGRPDMSRGMRRGM